MPTKEQEFRREFEQLRKEYPEVERRIKVAELGSKFSRWDYSW